MSVLDALICPPRYRKVRFATAFARRKEIGRPHYSPLSVFLDSGVIPRDSRDDNHNRLGVDLANYLVVRKGDVVFNKLRTWQGGFGASDYDGIVSPAYFVCVPNRAIVTARFAHHLLRSQPYLAELTRVSKWMPPSQFDITWDALRDVSLRVPPVEEQSRIADFLDAETARIDALCTNARRMKLLIVERLDREISRITVDQTIALQRLRDVVDGIEVGVVVQPAALYAPSGIPFLRGVNVRPGALVLDELKYLDPAKESVAVKSRLRAGDIVMVRTGQAGVAVTVPPELDGANCVDLLIVRPGRRVVSEYLELLLNSEFVRA